MPSPYTLSSNYVPLQSNAAPTGVQPGAALDLKEEFATTYDYLNTLSQDENSTSRLLTQSQSPQNRRLTDLFNTMEKIRATENKKIFKTTTVETGKTIL